MPRLIRALLSALLLFAGAVSAEPVAVLVQTSKGDITLELDADKAPETVKNFLRYVDEGFNDGTIFHRVIKNFMIQGGGFTPTMSQKKTHDPVKNEAKNGLKNARGTIAMARTSDPHSATAQFFINHKDNYLFLAGEPLDEPTARWASDSLGVASVDNYWQTETGWPILSAQPGVEDTPRRCRQPVVPVYGYDVRLLRAGTGDEAGADEKAVLTIMPPLPPGCMTTVWGDDARFVGTYFSDFGTTLAYSTFDWAIRDPDGYYFVLGRTDDVINVVGHRLGTREIEEAVQAHSGLTEVAVVGVAAQLKGQVPVAFTVAKDPARVSTPERVAQLRKEVLDTVDRELGAIARPGSVHFVTLLPKTRSGKLLRSPTQALAEGRDPGDLTTIEDPGALEQIKAALAG